MKKSVALMGMLAILFGGAADCEGSGTGKDAGSGGHGFQDPNPNQQAPVPAADPGAQNDPKHMHFQVIWKGERAGDIEVTILGTQMPQERGMTPKKDPNGIYYGHWTKDIAVQSGGTYGFTWFPDGPGMFAQCVLQYKGKVEDYQAVQTGSCAVSYKVP